MKPLEGYLVVDFSQFLSGPSASLRLADLGARVIKVEKPITGDICRSLYTTDLIMNGESSVFHAINRNKESLSADLKNPDDIVLIKKLLKQADVMIHNFRPGVMERLGLDFNEIIKVNPRIVYGEISGYGNEGPWKDRPGQDLLLQSLTGLTWLSGNAGDGPVPMGLSIVDMLAGANLVQGILACLIQQSRTEQAALVQVSMMETAYDFQFEAITTFYRDGGALPQRTKVNNAHAYLGAPYGIYQSSDGYIALAMGSIPVLGKLLKCPDLENYPLVSDAFDKRDEIKQIIAVHLKGGSTQQWLDLLEPADIWCAEVLTWDRLVTHEGFQTLEMIQEVRMQDGYTYRTTRCPIRIDGEYLISPIGSPMLGQDNESIWKEFGGEVTRES
ncbi:MULTISPECIES: CaiB/BaiF CoA transferase family protein [Olivibacter]|jgi:crotonobetainyl-CoA:carnitine CoA-transferase CaiB-like acyl-CoA transferase|uniref:Formyl-CoA transferase n=2 Tax=Sphingobacteriaceae TaxID=84566 RepID=F4CDD9_SPHS2|nr:MULTISPECIES: CaiB/BaiF CoA-transferase family protein [Olivibacter]MDM8176121.1 CaiB/BaiF CoA-transferase family protein [Olivibacter sp. 47]QEL00886.1 CoA transferase [Olivibacter sp. LS-1]